MSPSSSESTTLAEGVINGACDTISVELIRPADIPAAERTLKRAVIRITWPPADSVLSPQRFAQPRIRGQLRRAPALSRAESPHGRSRELRRSVRRQRALVSTEQVAMSLDGSR